MAAKARRPLSKHLNLFKDNNIYSIFVKMSTYSFPQRVWRLTRRIPQGKVSTYGALAQALGSPRAARAVGGALHVNPFAPKVPCHRVVRSNGNLGGFAAGSSKKRELLRQEGVVIRNGRIDLKKYFYEFKVKG